jgi:transposase
MHWTTLQKILAHAMPPGYRLSEVRRKPKLGEHLEWIEAVLESDKAMPRKQRHTASRLFERLVKERGYEGGYTQVREAVAELSRTRQEVFMPLSHRPGESQVDFFAALARIGGRLRKVHVFIMALPYSDAIFLRAYWSECTEAFQDGHVRAFEFLGGVPKRGTYDNTSIAVAQITGARDRVLTTGFLELTSTYLFEPHFCRVRRANEKGVVETLGKYARQRFLVPVPAFETLEALNEHLLACCREELGRRVRSRGRTKGELLAEERLDFLGLPTSPLEACRKRPGRANSLSLVRFRDNDYSVPVAYAHHELAVKGFVDRVVICTRLGSVIAEHERCWEKGRTIFDPRHYLALLERKPGSLDFAEPLAAWELDPCFGEMRRRLEERDPREGTREYIRILRLLEKFSQARVARAVEKALRHDALNASVVAMYCHPEEWPEIVTFRLEGREHLRGVIIPMPSLLEYGALLREGLA